MISMSDMKYNAIVGSGITINRRYESKHTALLDFRSPNPTVGPDLRRFCFPPTVPEDLIPPDSRVEIDAKIAAGYFSTTEVKDLSKTAGRLWEDLAH